MAAEDALCVAALQVVGLQAQTVLVDESLVSQANENSVQPGSTYIIRQYHEGTIG